jgi:predicted esterase
MQEHDCFFDFRARYYTLGNLDTNTKQIWFVLHGYGQLARYFIHKFKVLIPHNVYVVAPEGLSKFYLDAVESGGRASNRVGATWMTREDRLRDIENYLRFLDAVGERQAARFPAVPMTVFGFSQGAATASRWMMTSDLHPDRLILWAGIFPPDMDFQQGTAVLKNKETYFVYGSDDPYINDSRKSEMKNIASKLAIEPEIIVFNGKHEINERVLVSFA